MIININCFEKLPCPAAAVSALIVVAKITKVPIASNTIAIIVIIQSWFFRLNNFIMNQKERATKILRILKNQYPNVQCALNHDSAWQLLLATILSAQCTDERVNQVTKNLFNKYPTVYDINELDIAELKDIIRPTGFYNNKAKHIKASAEKIVKQYSGKVPDSMEELLTLPGVARKTANVVLGVWFNKNQGIAVDTHVKRLSQRYGLTDETSPQKIEQDLMQLFPKQVWENISLLLIQHGREVASARNPDDENDPLKEFILNS